MGCASSKQVSATSPLAVYKPPPSGFAVFDINTIEEPWLKLDNNLLQLEDQQKPSHLPTPLLEKLDTLENEVSNGPQSWEEVSKALEDLNKPKVTKPAENLALVVSSNPSPPRPKKSFSFHTLEDLDKKSSGKNINDGGDDDVKKVVARLRKVETSSSESTRGEFTSQGRVDPGDFRSVKANPFIVRDRIEAEREGKEAAFDRIIKAKRDPLNDFQEICPPGGAQLVVLYTTSLGGIRRTFEDCNRVRMILENHRVVFDERDVSLHGEFRAELKDLVGAESFVPRLFVKGRYLGGADEVVDLNESGRLGRIFAWGRVERGAGWQGCEGCGGARFMPCMDCGGSCKVMVGDSKERCPKCNENGLVHCPRCH